MAASISPARSEVGHSDFSTGARAARSVAMSRRQLLAAPTRHCRDKCWVIMFLSVVCRYSMIQYPRPGLLRMRDKSLGYFTSQGSRFGPTDCPAGSFLNCDIRCQP
ncbi:hypothetical protein M8818_000426 [Zalaria obscura]|uniref:Uncharacterized protein n=1 Tax=Zalaria obscura TaxID=2024903 RepID=A0ACC3SPP3_9PEZI